MTMFEALMRTNKLNPHGRTFDQNIEHLNNISKCAEKSDGNTCRLQLCRGLGQNAPIGEEGM